MAVTDINLNGIVEKGTDIFKPIPYKRVKEVFNILF